MVKKIVIGGGKGGTGKSTVATSLAYSLSKENKVLLLDLDVECPNDQILLSIKLDKIKDVESFIPKFNEEKCKKCGKCGEVCKEHAIVNIKNRFPILVKEQCNGCKACKIACPYGAIENDKQIIGHISKGKIDRLNLISGELKPGIEEASKIVNEIKKLVKTTEEKYEFIIIDAAPGTHCNVISSMKDNDLFLAVTEPTPFGAHDVSLVLELAKKLKLKSKIVLNRSDIGNEKIINKISEKYKSEIISKIPYNKEIFKQYSDGKPIINNEIENLKDKIKEILDKKE